MYLSAYAPSGAFSDGGTATTNSLGSNNVTERSQIFKASDSNSVYTNSGHVYPLSLALNFIIKA